MMNQISVRVCDEAHGVEKVYELQQPYAILGAGSGVDVTLPVSSNGRNRRFYLQAVDAGVIAVELANRIATDGSTVGAQLLGERAPLRIGPYAVIAECSSSQSAGLPQSTPGTMPAKLENRLLENTWLYFINGHSRATRKSVRHLRETLTLIGSSKQCHLKLSHPEVARFQCSVVRNGEDLWIVALSQRNDLRVNGRPIRNSRLTVGDILSIGPFRMQLQHGEPTESTPRFIESSSANQDDKALARSGAMSSPSLSGQRPSNEPAQDRSAEWDAVSCSSDSDVMSLVEQFTAVQHLLMAQSQQQASMLLHLIRNVQTSHDSQQQMIEEQLSAIQGISDDLQSWRSDLEHKSVTPQRHLEDAPQQLPAQEAPPSERPPERTPKTAEEIRAHASLSERINFLERERKSLLQKIIRLLPGQSSAHD